MRHLLFDQAAAAINRGKQVEQLLGRHLLADNRIVVRWITVYPSAGEVLASLHEGIETDLSTSVHELGAFDLNEDHGEGRNLGSWSTAEAALQALTATGAAPDKWVNFGVLQDEVNDAQANSTGTKADLDLSDSALSFLESVASRADPAPWTPWIEGRDGMGGDSFIMVGPQGNRSEDIYIQRETTTRTWNELDAIAISRSYLVPLLDEIRKLRARVAQELDG